MTGEDCCLIFRKSFLIMIILIMEQTVETIPMTKSFYCQSRKYTQTVPNLMDLILIIVNTMKQEEARAVLTPKPWEHGQVRGQTIRVTVIGGCGRRAIIRLTLQVAIATAVSVGKVIM